MAEDTSDVQSERTRLEADADDRVEVAGLEMGTRLGRYVALEQIGRGGMGVVYAAYDPELQRRIALKLLETDSADGGARTRLQREAQALARLSHPNVITVYDVGTLGESVFIAMELIHGPPLRRWLREETRTWQETLGVFIAAGRGLAAAHEVGLVHRDFKPGNVLVGRDGRVLVLDFGLARPASRTDDTDWSASHNFELPAGDANALSSHLTETGTVMGTPAYMSPEQLLGQPLDARSDQFSYAVALYEGLYGSRPFSATKQDRLAHAKLEGLIEDAPEGSRVPAWLRRAILRGLAPDPDGRWRDMGTFLAELGRNRAAARRRLGTVVVGIVAVIAGVAGLAQLRNTPCGGADERLIGVWDDNRRASVQAAFIGTRVEFAEASLSRVEAWLDTHVQRWIASHASACEATHVHGTQPGQVLDQRMDCLSQRLAETRALVDVFARADPKVVERAVEAVADLTPIERCDAAHVLAVELAPPPPGREQLVRDQRERLARARAVAQTGRYSEGLALAESVVAEATSLDYAPLLAEALFRLGRLQELTGEYELAEQTLGRAAWEATGCGHDDLAAAVMNDLVFVVGYSLARPDQATRWARHAESIVLRLEAQGRPRGAKLLANVGAVQFREGNYQAAHDLFARALAVFESELGPQHPRTASALQNMGTVLEWLERHDEAKHYQARALATMERLFGPDHPEVAAANDGLGNALEAAGDFAAARVFLEHSLRLRRRTLGPRHTEIADNLNNLGIVLMNLGENDHAVSRFREALAIYEQTIGLDHPNAAGSLGNLGIVFERRGRLSQASAYYERAFASYERTLGADHPNIAIVLHNLGRVALADGRGEIALSYHRRGLGLRERLLGPDSSAVAESLRHYGETADEIGRRDEAAEFLARADALDERIEQAPGPATR